MQGWELAGPLSLPPYPKYTFLDTSFLHRDLEIYFVQNTIDLSIYD